jgi:hypothetical protein
VTARRGVGEDEAGDAEEEAGGAAGVDAGGFDGGGVRGVGAAVAFFVGEGFEDGAEGVDGFGEGGEGRELEVEGVGEREGVEALADGGGDEPEGERFDGGVVVAGDGLERGLGGGELVDDGVGAGGGWGEGGRHKWSNRKGSNGQKKRRRGGETERRRDGGTVRG